MSDLPKAWGVLYAPPNPDGSRKKCENCAFFVDRRNRCLIHAEEIEITPGMVCGYHVYGAPVPPGVGAETLIQAEPLDPKLSGLEDVSHLDGTSCGECRFFEATKNGNGLCHGVAKASGRPPQPVEERGCCARWELV